MSFKAVYRTLMDLFPQVDARILKAVAIEHPKDADAAAEVVISEVLPYISRKSMVGSPLCDDSSLSGRSGGRAEHDEPTDSLRHRQVSSGKTVPSSSESRLIANEGASPSDPASAIHLSDSTYQDKTLNLTTGLSCDTTVDTNQLHGNIETEELILLVRPENQEDKVQSSVMSSVLTCDENTVLQSCASNETEILASFDKFQDINIKAGHEQTSQILSTSSALENVTFDCILTEHHNELKDFDINSAHDSDTPLCGKGPQIESSLDGSSLKIENSAVEETFDAAEGDLQLEFSTTPTNNYDVWKTSEDIKIDVLEDVVEAAKNNKRTLFLAMESVMNKMRHVELQEKAAEQAKEEAASAGLDILAKAEELKKLLGRAKEANDMHAGEVYGEKAILATEARELQARIFNLSVERDEALAILDEMHQTLEARLAAAEELRKTMEKQKLEEEESARNVLAEQDAIMEKVVQESKILQQEAEENSKLQEFLMDRGHVVDTLQGEISVICQDVRLLKKKYDEHVPLSNSISSSQTSCILASSGSSLKSIASHLVPESMDSSKSPEGRSPASSIRGESPKSQLEGSPKSQLEEEGINRKELLNDGWDFFENEAEAEK